MASVPHDFVTVDMRGLKASLVERSHATRVSVSALVREFVEKGLGPLAGVSPQPTPSIPRTRAMVKLSLRISAFESERLTFGAARAGLSRSAYLAELILHAPTSATRAERSEILAALAASNAELSTLSRNVRGLSLLIQQGSTQSAKEHARLLDTIVGDVRQHLSRSAAVLWEARAGRGVTSRNGLDSQRSGGNWGG